MTVIHIVKTCIFIAFISFFVACGSDNNGIVTQLTWEKTYGGSDHDEAYSVKQTTDGGYIIAGFTQSFGAGYADVYLIKTDSNGNTQWEKTYGVSYDDRAYSVKQTTDGGYIIAGYTWPPIGTGYGDFYLIKTDENGNLQWEKTYGDSSAEDMAYSVQQTSDGGYIIAGYTRLFVAGSTHDDTHDVYLIKTDANGSMQWEKTYGGPEHYYYMARSVQQTTDGGYIIAGTTLIYFSGYSDDVYLIKTDENGNMQWEKNYGSSDSDFAYSVQQTTDGGYIITGRTKSFDSGYTDVYLIKTDSNGNMQWEKTYGVSHFDEGHSVQQTSDGGYIIAGFTLSFDSGYYEDVYLIKTDENGNTQWGKTFGGLKNDGAHSVQQTTDGGYIIAGYTASFGAGYADVYLIKTDSNGNMQ